MQLENTSSGSSNSIPVKEVLFLVLDSVYWISRDIILQLMLIFTLSSTVTLHIGSLLRTLHLLTTSISCSLSPSCIRVQGLGCDCPLKLGLRIEGGFYSNIVKFIPNKLVRCTHQGINILELSKNPCIVELNCIRRTKERYIPLFHLQKTKLSLRIDKDFFSKIKIFLLYYIKDGYLVIDNLVNELILIS
ncbi:hypothetical protein Avbf_15810 [Armadillidium vulgare]|nr:hypothetical protein Avbf_15810 [Armadillidium vulgare]